MSAGQMIFSRTETVVFGRSAAEVIAEFATQREARRVLLMVSQSLRRNTDAIARIEAALGERHALTWSGMGAHVPRPDLLEATRAAADAKADLIVTVGGGSISDGGKILTLALKHGVGAIEDFDRLHTSIGPDGALNVPKLDDPDVGVICVPTTLSGGEFNSASGSLDTRTMLKNGYQQPGMAPVAVILDPEITVHTPPWLWFSTGVRAVDHAVETLASRQSNAFADGLAENALRLLSGGLSAVSGDSMDMEARLKCQMGAWQAMMPIVGGVPMGASHSIGHALGGLCHVPHGYTSCVMSPAVLAWNADDDGGRQARIAEALGAGKDESASQVLDRIIAGLGMPRRLSEVGVRADQFPQLAAQAMKGHWTHTNPRSIRGESDLIEIVELAA